MLDLRILSADEWTAWREVRLAALQTAPEAFHSKYDDWVSASEDRWRSRLSMPGAIDYVAYEVDDVNGRNTERAVGMATGIPGEASTTDRATSYAEIVSLWVHPAFRGRGVATKLMEAVTRWACQGGFGGLKLCVVPENTIARCIYERKGFTIPDEPMESISGDPNSVIMVQKFNGVS